MAKLKYENNAYPKYKIIHELHCTFIVFLKIPVYFLGITEKTGTFWLKKNLPGIWSSFQALSPENLLVYDQTFYILWPM